MEPEWKIYLRENAPRLYAAMDGDVAWDNEWRNNRIAALESALAASQDELSTQAREKNMLIESAFNLDAALTTAQERIAELEAALARERERRMVASEYGVSYHHAFEVVILNPCFGLGERVCRAIDSARIGEDGDPVEYDTPEAALDAAIDALKAAGLWEEVNL